MHDRSSAGAVDQSAVSMRAAGMEDTAAVVEGQLEAELTAMSLDDALCLARAFSHYLNLMGIAETHHRVSYRPRRDSRTICRFRCCSTLTMRFYVSNTL